MDGERIENERITLDNKLLLVTCAARRIGRALAHACAQADADILLHYGHSRQGAVETQEQVKSIGRRAWIISADLSQPAEVSGLINQANKIGIFCAPVNSAAKFEALSLQETNLSDLEIHLSLNLTAPFLLCQGFARQLQKDEVGRIVNILDWRALRPGADHFPYTVSKAALAALTQSLAIALAPSIAVNGLALGAIFPPADGPAISDILKNVPAARWGTLTEIEEALVFLLTGPAYLTGEIVLMDSSRHLI